MEHTISTLSSDTVFHSWRVTHPRATIILQHGYCECSERYIASHHELIQTLNARNFSVYAIDLAGHGRSPGIRGVTDINKAVADHVQLRQEIHSKAKDERASPHPVFLLSHSLGGLVTTSSVLAMPSNVHGVILLSPALQAPLNLPLRWFVNAAACIFPTASIPIPPRPLSELSRRPSQEILARSDPLLQKRQVPYLLASTALAVAERDLAAARLGEWHAPTLVMHGTADRYTDHAQSERFVACIRSPDKTFRSWPGAYHELLNDLVRDEILHEILSWLEVRVSAYRAESG